MSIFSSKPKNLDDFIDKIKKKNQTMVDVLYEQKTDKTNYITCIVLKSGKFEYEYKKYSIAKPTTSHVEYLRATYTLNKNVMTEAIWVAEYLQKKGLEVLINNMTVEKIKEVKDELEKKLRSTARIPKKN